MALLTSSAERLKAITVTIKASCGADGRLYGSVTAKDISERLAADFGISIDKRKITVSDPIKAYGRYALEVKLYPEVTGTVYHNHQMSDGPEVY